MVLRITIRSCAQVANMFIVDTYYVEKQAAGCVLLWFVRSLRRALSDVL